MYIYMYTYIYIYTYIEYTPPTYIFPGKKGELMFEVLSQAIEMMPIRSSCFKQVSLDSPGRRAYTVTSFKSCMSRVAQGEYNGKQLGIASCWGDQTKSHTYIKWVSNAQSLRCNLPKRATLQIMINIILAIGTAK